MSMRVSTGRRESKPGRRWVTGLARRLRNWLDRYLGEREALPGAHTPMVRDDGPSVGARATLEPLEGTTSTSSLEQPNSLEHAVPGTKPEPSAAPGLIPQREDGPWLEFHQPVPEFLQAQAPPQLRPQAPAQFRPPFPPQFRTVAPPAILPHVSRAARQPLSAPDFQTSEPQHTSRWPQVPAQTISPELPASPRPERPETPPRESFAFPAEAEDFPPMPPGEQTDTTLRPALNETPVPPQERKEASLPAQRILITSQTDRSDSTPPPNPRVPSREISSEVIELPSTFPSVPDRSNTARDQGARPAVSGSPTPPLPGPEEDQPQPEFEPQPADSFSRPSRYPVEAASHPELPAFTFRPARHVNRDSLPRIESESIFASVRLPEAAVHAAQHALVATTSKTAWPDSFEGDMWPELPADPGPGSFEMQKNMRLWERSARLAREQRGEP